MRNPFIIAEIGINHNGDINIAKQLIDMAKNSGCDAVKFQKRTIDLVYTPEFLDSPRESPWGSTNREQKIHLEFGKEQYDIIDTYCKEKGIEWLCSGWDLPSLSFLKQYNLKYNKIASPMISNGDFVTEVARQKKMTFISLGKASDRQIEFVISVFDSFNCPFVLLHCIDKYPCPDEFCNLKRIVEIKREYGRHVGYSNHNPSILVPSLAILLGAEVIEVHTTLDRTLYGSDQPASFEKLGLEYIVRDCHRVREIIG